MSQQIYHNGLNTINNTFDSLTLSAGDARDQHKVITPLGDGSANMKIPSTHKIISPTSSVHNYQQLKNDASIFGSNQKRQSY